MGYTGGIMMRWRPFFSLLAISISAVASCQEAQRYLDIHDFGGTTENADGKSGPDGVETNAGVTFDKSGNMYGTTYAGGPNAAGIVWEITASGQYRDLHDFGGAVVNANGIIGTDGSYPAAAVSVDATGDIYGTAQVGGAFGGGSNSGGIVWEITSSGTYLDLHDFSGPDGALPSSRVTLDASGNLFGTAEWGGAHASGNMGGVVWEITVSGEYRDLHDFGGFVINANGTNGPDGVTPNAGVTFDGFGNMFGTTVFGGANEQTQYGSGIVWEITASGTYIDLHDFGDSSDGAMPQAGVTFDSAGNMFGTAFSGGANGVGIIWEISSLGAYRHIHDFGGTITNTDGTMGPDGANPYFGNVTFDGYGNMVGAALYGGAHFLSPWQTGGGMIWEITSSGQYLDLHDFGGTITIANGADGPDGNFPAETVTFDANGRMYGTTSRGGPNGQPAYHGYGMVWSLLNVSVVSVSLSPALVVGGDSTTGTVNLSTPAGSGGAIVSLSSSSTSAVVPSSVTIAAGASSATFTVTTTVVATDIDARITVTLNNSAASTTLTIQAPLLLSLSVAPNTVVGGNFATGTVNLARNAPSGGATISLSSSPEAGIPASVTVPGGSSNINFTITTTGQSSNVIATITATLNGVNKSGTLSITPAVLTGLTFTPNPVTGGTSALGTVSLNGAAPIGGISVGLTSSRYATVPASVTIGSGAFSAQFPISTPAICRPEKARITASSDAGFQTASLTIRPATLLGVTLSPSGVVGGSKTRVLGTLALTGPAGPAGMTVILTSSDPMLARVPDLIRIPGGISTAVFTVSHRQVKRSQAITITASDHSISQSATLTLSPFQIVNLSLVPTSVVGGLSATGSVTINAVVDPASGPVWVYLSSTSGVVKLPAKVKVDGSSAAATFEARTIPVASAMTATLTATLGSSSQTSELTVLPPDLTSVSLSPASVKGSSDNAVTGTVAISSPAPNGGLVIALTTSNNSAAQVPTTVKVPAGHTGATFKVTHFAVTALSAVEILATLNNESKSATLTVKP